jgi:hypothetical protein
MDATEVHLANPSWGNTAHLISAHRIPAEVALRPLLRGEYRLGRVAVERPVIALERDTDGTGNWIVPPSVPRGKIGLPAGLPVRFVGAIELHDGDLTFRTTRHRMLRIHVTDADLRAAGDNAPVIVGATGSYNGLPVRASVLFESFAALLRVPRPVAAHVVLSGTRTTLELAGTMTDPLRFDGIEGHLDLMADPLAELGTAIGTTEFADRKLVLSGALDRQGDRSAWSGLTGFFDGATVAGTLGLDEGSKGKPDHFDIGLHFGPLDLGRLGLGRSATPWQTGFSLHPDDDPGEKYKIRLAIKAANYRRYKLDAIDIDARTEPATIYLDRLSFSFAGGRLAMAGSEQAVGTEGRLRLDATAAGIDPAQVLSLAGVDTPTLAGNLNAGMRLDIAGKTPADALGASDAVVVLSMQGGQLSRRFLQRASADVRGLAKGASGQVPVDCFLVAASMTDGVVSVLLLRLKTREGDLFGGGRIDLRRESIDMLVQSDSRSTDFWALDIPLRIAGGLSDPRALPSPGPGRAGTEPGSATKLALFPSALRPPVGKGC